jgi:hypothetical protein
MKRYLFYLKRDGEIQCLYAETNVGMVDTDAIMIRVIEADDYETAKKQYESCTIVKETLKSIDNKTTSLFDLDEDIYRMYYGWGG